MFNILAEETANSNGWLMWVLIGVLLIVMLVMPMFTNKKKQKEINDMFDSLKVGDEIMTIGRVENSRVRRKAYGYSDRRRRAKDSYDLYRTGIAYQLYQE